MEFWSHVEMSEVVTQLRDIPAVGRHLQDVPADHNLIEKLVLNGFDGPVLCDALVSGSDDLQTVVSRFFNDLATVDFDWIANLRQAVMAGPGAQSTETGPGGLQLEPFPFTTFDDPGTDRGYLQQVGMGDLAAGNWGVVVFAGGAATRFWAGAAGHSQAAAVLKRFGGVAPKGLFPLGAKSGRSFLDLFAGEMVEMAERTGRCAPLILMAGRDTRAALQEWVDTSLPAGMDRSLVRVMVQAEHPRLDENGDLLVRPDGSLVFTGDGHGGVFRAMLVADEKGGNVVSWLSSLGVKNVVLHNVDNVAARALEPTRLGFHSAGSYQMTMSAVPRTDPFEKVGIVARNVRTEKVDVVEYSVCPDEVATALDPAGNLLFVPAHINTNLVSLDAVRADLPRTLYSGKQVDIGGRLVGACSHAKLQYGRLISQNTTTALR